MSKDDVLRAMGWELGSQSNTPLDVADLTHEQVERILKWHSEAQRQLLTDLMEQLPSKRLPLPHIGTLKSSGYNDALTEVTSVIQNLLGGEK